MASTRPVKVADQLDRGPSCPSQISLHRQRARLHAREPSQRAILHADLGSKVGQGRRLGRGSRRLSPDIDNHAQAEEPDTPFPSLLRDGGPAECLACRPG